jgi:adenylylsulfate kinase
VIHRGVTVWFTGLSGAGKSTIAEELLQRLKEHHCRVELLDGDIVRTNLSKGLGFSREDRDTNIRRIGFVADLLTRNGVITLVAAISPYRAVRDEVRAVIGNFVEVHVSTPLDECIRRDVKGLYKKAIAGELPQFTGISDPYEAPKSPELELSTLHETPAESATRIWAWLEDHGYIVAHSGDQVQRQSASA